MKPLKINLFILALSAVLILPNASLIKAAEAGGQANLQTCNQTESLQVCQKRILLEAGGGPTGYGDNANITDTTLAQKVGQVVGMVLSVFGIVFFGLVVYSGIQWMTAGGNEEKVTHARERIIRAAIGLGIVMMAYALTSFIVDRMKIADGQVMRVQCTQDNYRQACPEICRDDRVQGCDNDGQCMCEPDGGA